MRATALLFAVCLFGCGASQDRDTTPVKSETSVESITRIGTRWEARSQARGFRSAPSPVASYELTEISELTIGADGAVHETLRMEERLETRDGVRHKCSTVVEHELRAKFGRHAGEPAVALTRPTRRVARRCTPGPHPDGSLEIGGEARFVLSSDSLKAFAPVTERRTYLPLE